MISIGSNGEKIAYGIRHYNLDTEEDLKRLQKSKKMTMGCTCFIIENSKYYMLNGEQKWIEITPFGKMISSEGGDIILPDNPEIPDDDIIYEGGVI